ncbi:hypothetical protein B0H63DRAFT_492924 [Podospora didyma]|uniref:C2H2-type domain-containing protein n=1 Tax=Podospora didyma TaxID=330526 RepID=A0AAE0U4G6_9PEZI|nr:hypothetical protein B0H63DRAFT_492924 [Podospora didyma]
METGSRGSYPVPSRVAQKLSNGTVISIPVRTRSGTSPRTKTKHDMAMTTDYRHGEPESESDASPSPDASSPDLDGATPPASPIIIMATLSDAKLILSHHHSKAGDLPSIEEPMKDLSFRRHNRGIGSIDSILSSTTCVNTHSECSRPESQLSHAARSNCDDVCTPRLHHPLNMEYGIGPEIGVDHGEEDDLEDESVDEISSSVLGIAWGKDLGDCAAPLLVQDCTSRYIQELWSAAHNGKLGGVRTASGQASPSGAGGGGTQTLGSANPNHNENKGKRKAEGSDEDESVSGGWGGDGNDRGGGVSASPAADSTKSCTTSNFSCPYRKRNPLRFNVRDRYVCATHSFADMSQLKKHIRAHHPPVQRNAGPFLCPRCRQGFPSKDDFDCHLRQPVVCRLADDQNGSDPEDGITQKIISSLEARSQRSKIDNWNSLWKLLFPTDVRVPGPAFVPVMEIFDFVSESKRLLSTLKDLLEIQYRHVLEDTGQPVDIELKIHQGLERSTQSMYNWMETVVQDWEQRIAGAVSSFSGSSDGRPGRAENWAGTSQLLPPSPALTPAVVLGNTNARDNLADDESLRGPQNRRQLNPPPKRAKRANPLVKAKPMTQIPVPIQRAGTPQSHLRAVTTNTLRSTPSLPALHLDQSVASPGTNPAKLERRSSYHQGWESPAVTVPTTYGMPYNSPVVYHSPSTPLYPAAGHNQLPSSYFPPDTTMGAEGTYEGDVRQAGAARERQSILSSTPRTSLSWIRDENRDSSQTLVEAHPAGRCSNIYCPSCSKTIPEAILMPQGLPTSGVGQVFVADQSQFRGGEIPFPEQHTEWHHFHNVSGGGGTGNNDMFGGPREGY